VLLIGESGTGKELLAAHIHKSSPFAGGPFVKVNCAAIPTELIETELFGHEKGSFTGATSARRGKFELADGGTIFLDEVGDLHSASQAKLLRVLQEGEFHRVGGEQIIHVSVRVISATNRDLGALVTAEKFREDLFYRLSVVPIRVPALRERPHDVRLLAEYFLEDFCARNNFKPKRMDETVFPLLESYLWPGNARELRNAVERMAILTPGERLTRDSVPVEIRMQRETGVKSTIQEARESAEREHVLRALEESNWNVSGAARALGMELIDQLGAAQFDAVVRLLEVMVEPLARSLALAPVEEEEITPETAAALNRARASLARGEGIPHEEVLREFGLSQ
jgi:two-component system nitrogen regulation response regulator NtrX